MAVVGSANIIVRAITKDVQRDIRQGFRSADGIGKNAGRSLGARFVDSFGKSSGGLSKRLTSAFGAIQADSLKTQQAWTSLMRTGMTVQTVVGVLAGSLGSLVGGLGSLVGSAGAAGASMIALAGTFISLKIGVSLAKLALSGVGQALNKLKSQQSKGAKDLTNQQRAVDDAFQALAQTIERNAERLSEANKRVTRAQRDLNEALEEGKEELQQLGFEAEDAALAEKRAAMELEDARAALARVQDLPPNSRARKEAELAFAEAELNLRKAKDRTADLAKEQDKLAGKVENTDVVIRATEALAEAEDELTKTVRDGSREQEEAKKRLARAQEDLKKAEDGDGGGGSDPFEGLTESQIDFVKYLATIQPELDKLKEAVAKGFLPELEKQIDRAIKEVFPTLTTGFETVGVSLGVSVRNFMDEVTKSANLSSLAQVFETTAYVVEKFGTIGGKAFGIIVTMLDAADPLIRRFVDFIENRAGVFDDFLKTKNATGELEAFFNRSGDIAADFGTVFGNVFNGIGDLIADSFEPGSGGDILLQWLKDATAGFAAIGDDKGGLRAFLQGTATNSIAIFQSIGALIKEVIALGAMPEIKVFWDTLKAGAPLVGEILKNGIEAGPSLANLVVSVTRIVAVLSDSGAIKVFFDTLNFFATAVANILENEVVRNFVDFIAKIAAFGSAIGLVATIGSSLFGVLAGIITKLSLLTGIAAGPLALILALGAAMIYLYQNNEEFKASIDNTIAVMGSLLTIVGEMVGTLLSTLAPILGNIATLFADLVIALMPLVNTVLIALVGVLQAIMTPLMTLLPILLKVAEIIIGVLLDAFKQLLPAIEMIVAIVADSLITAINTLLPPIVTLVTTLLMELLPVFMQIVDAGMAIVTQLLEFLVPVIDTLLQAFLRILPVIVDELVPAFLGIVEAVIPVVMQLVDMLVPAIMMIIDAVLPVVTMLIDMFVPVLALIIETVVILVAQLMENFVPIFNVVIAIVGTVVKIFMTLFTTIFKILMPVLKVLISIFAAVVAVIANTLIPIVATVVSVFTGGWSDIGKHFKGAINNMIGLVEGFVNFFIDGINKIIDGFKGLKFDVPSWVPFIGGKTFSLNIAKIPKFKLPRLAEGGVVFPQPGGVLAQIAEAGRAERVEPLDSTGLSQRDRAMIEQLAGDRGKGVVVHMTVNPSEGMDERELAAVISRQLAFQFRKGAIR